jgi:hypothetical protein
MFGCENRTTVPIEVTFNIGKLNNCARSTQQSIIKKMIEPNRVEYLMSIRREDISQAPLRLESIDFKFRLAE